MDNIRGKLFLLGDKRKHIGRVKSKIGPYFCQVSGDWEDDLIYFCKKIKQFKGANFIELYVRGTIKVLWLLKSWESLEVQV